MITADDIKMLVASGEGYNAEFKVSVPAKVKELSEEVCAFANAAGGVLLIGINDQNNVVGVTIDNAKRSAIQNSLNEITPRLSCALSFVEVDGKNIGVIEVPSGPNKPYVLSGAIFVRIGPNTQKLTTAEQMRDFFQQSDKIYFDEMPCPEYHPETMTDMDFLSVFKAESHISSGIPDEQIFRSLKLYSNGNQFKNGAVLFFGTHPEEIIPTAILRCVAYQGADKRFIIDDKPFAGNLYQQFQQAMMWLRSKLEISYDIEGQGSGPRREIWEIPETVFKEAILNALAHRDYYDKGGVILLELFDNRVELSNPGGLVSAIPESEFGKRSHSRNPLIFGLFARMHLVEQVGSGIVRMHDLMHEAKLPPPQFQKTGIFTITLMRPEKSSEKGSEKGSEKSSEKSSEKIIELIKEYPAVTIAEMAESLGISTRAVEKQLAKLKSKNIIDRIGSYKDGYWIIKNQESKGK
jgi:ATP-dependent DNA helicase RecG